jgi:hypothetical protein
MFIPSQYQGGSSRFYRVKLVLFIVGTAAILAGIRLGWSWLVNVGIGVLAAAMILRFLAWRMRKDE